MRVAVFVWLLLGWVPAAWGQAADIVLYPSDVSLIQGNWARLASTTGAGGQKLSSADRGWATPDAPLANPADYFEATFQADAGVAYRLWLRLRGAGDSKWNESVWVQFSGAVTSGGVPLWPVGSTSALLVNLEDCSNCGVSGWGWQDNAWWLGTSSVVRFAVSGAQTIRVQTREDGVDVDQIVLSPVRFFTSPPGPVRNDTTIVPKSGTPESTLVRQPYVQFVTENSAWIVWTTREGGASEVRYAASGGATRVGPAQTRLFTAAATGFSHDFYQHEAELGGLSAGTTYAYDVFTGGVDLTPHTSDTFRTGPEVGTGTVRFIAFGDSGTGSTAQHQVAQRLAADTFDLALHTGDVAYGNSSGTGGGNYRQYDDWVFGIYGTWMRARPFFPSMGNHDVEVSAGQPYRDVFVLPRNGASASFPDHSERFYSFDYGAIHFVALDTEVAFQNATRRQAQLDWLRADLASTTQPWKVVYFHRSPYSAGQHHGSDLAVRAAFAPIFEEHGVQLVLSAHEHIYERSWPWREFTSDGAAVTYVVTGGGGAPLYPAGSQPWTARSLSAHHYVRAVAGTGCLMTLEAVGLDGNVLDRGEIDRCAAPPPPPPAPAHLIPGLIQAEDFDQGPNGTAYFDTTAGNSGGQYRATDVDIERTGDMGGGYNVGWIARGEWLNFTVDVQTAGSYTLEARVASPGGASMRVVFDGVDRTGAMAIPATGAWQTWTTVSRSVTLPAGRQVMRLVFDTGGHNVNYVRLTSASGSQPYGGTPRAIPGTIQSEDFDDGGQGVAYFDRTAGNNGGQYRATDVDIERTGDTGGGFNVGWASATEWLNYTVNVTAAGTYALTVRIASPAAGGIFHVEFNGVNKTGPLQVPNTGGWQTYHNLTVPVTLDAGVQIMRLVLDSNSSASAVGNFNYIRVQ
jgi:hypothetical protein